MTIHGHDKEVKKLKDLFEQNRISPAIILQGEKGLGKSLIAKELTKYIFNHEKNKIDNIFSSEPFNDDDNHDNIANRMEKGSYADFLLIQKEINDKGKMAKDISITQIRKFNDFLKKKPIEGKWKVIIIDAVDDLNKSSANAMLKSIEEPPKNTLIILINHSAAKILPTIRSRAQVFNINKISENDINRFLRDKFNINNESDIKIITTLCNGNPGFAAKMVSINGIEIYENICRKLLKNDLSIIEEFSSKEISDDEYELFKSLLLKLQQRIIDYVQSSNDNLLLKHEKDLFDAKLSNKPKDKQLLLSLIESYQQMEKAIANENQFSMDRKQSINRYISKAL